MPGIRISYHDKSASRKVDQLVLAVPVVGILVLGSDVRLVDLRIHDASSVLTR